MAKKSSKKKSTSVSVDFTDVESNGLVPEGDYVFEVDEVSRETSDNSGEDYLSWKLKVVEGDYKGRTLFHNTSLQPQALFNLRSLLEALGQEIPEGKMDLDLDELIGERGACSVAHEKYKGKTKARPVEFFTEEELEKRGDGEEEEEEKPKGKKSKADDDEPKGKDKKKGKKEEAEEEEEKPKGKGKKKGKKEEPEFEVGDTVTFEDDEGDEKTGEITEIDGDDITVKVGKGKKAEEFVVEPGDLTKVED